MNYITIDDCHAIIQERLLAESIADLTALPDARLDMLENKAIAFAKSYIAGRYDVSEAFSTAIIRNEVLVHVIASLVVFWAVRRNAARKVPEDFVELYNGAIKILDKIESGKQILEGFTPITAPDGTTSSLIWGNNTKDNYFV